MPSKRSSQGSIKYDWQDQYGSEAENSSRCYRRYNWDAPGSQYRAFGVQWHSRRIVGRVLSSSLLAASLLATSVWAQSGDQTPSHSDVAQASASSIGSPYIPLDSWIYPAAIRLYYLGYLPTAYIGMRPWTRASLAHMLTLSKDSLESTDTPGEAVEINARLRRELAPELANDSSTSLRTESIYTRLREIHGPILNDSFHLGQTIVNDYGRPDQPGFNNLTGFSAEAHGGRFSLYVRSEYQHAPAAIGYSPAVAAQLAAIDGTPDVPQSTIPAQNIPAQNNPTVVEANASAHLLGHEISFGKSDAWLGPGLGASMGWSNNAPDIYSFRINRVEPLYVPGLSRFVGLFRYDFMVGTLKGHAFPNAPWIHMEKISMKLTPDLEFGFVRSVIWGGEGHVPITIGTFLRSFFSVTAPPPAIKFSRQDPGARFSTFDFLWRVPWDNHLVTLYTDSFAHDNVFPVSNPYRSGLRPGFYIARLPKLPRWDFRAEGTTTNPHDPESNQGRLLLWESVQVQGYTNKGYILGDWIGREATGGQAWLTWHLKPDQQIQFQYRTAKVAQDFVPRGTTQHDISAEFVLRPMRALEVKTTLQGELWKAPLIAQGQQKDFVGTVQLTYFLHPQ